MKVELHVPRINQPSLVFLGTSFARMLTTYVLLAYLLIREADLSLVRGGSYTSWKRREAGLLLQYILSSNRQQDATEIPYTF